MSSPTPDPAPEAAMRIDWDVPTTTDDGIVLRADVYLPLEPGQYPVLLSHGPCGKGLAFQEAYRPQWDYMIERYPEVAEGTSSRYQNWEVVDNRGIGPFIHTDPDDRPAEIFEGNVTIHLGTDTDSHLLVPIVPETGHPEGGA